MSESKKAYMEEKEIQAFEAMGESRLFDHLKDHMTPEYAEKFTKLLRSYRMAARVANAAWRYIEIAEREPNNQGALQCCIEDLQSALSDYAPQRVKQPLMELLHVKEILIWLYNSIPEVGTNAEAKEIVYRVAEQADSLYQKEAV